MNNGHYGFSDLFGLLRVTALRVLGKAGATAGCALAGATTSGAPTAGAFDTGDAVIAQDAALWVCTAGGSPGTWSSVGGGGGGGGGTGTVTSVDVSVPSPLATSGGPITSSGTIALSWASGQTANRVLASPNGSSGAVSLRALVGDDLPVDASTIISSGGVIAGNYQAGSGVSISGNTITATGSGGSVTSVALTAPSSILAVSGSPVTSSGTLAVSLQNQNANTLLCGPASGSAAAPTFRSMVDADLPPAFAAGAKLSAAASCT